jgi:phospholipase/carboxylesterase
MMHTAPTLHNSTPLTTGRPLAEAEAALILLHGRGDSAAGILGLAQVLDVAELAYLAPQADNHTWYPERFIAPIEANEPWLSAALGSVQRTVDTVQATDIPLDRIAIGGFSQGACLALEFAARNPQRYGGIFAFSGGLIGPEIDRGRYHGELHGTPVFLGCSDRDFHIPKERVHASSTLMTELGGEVVERIYPGMGHTINQDEIDHVTAMLTALVSPVKEKP